MKKIDELNANPENTATYGINSLADRTEEEFKALRGAVQPEEDKNDNGPRDYCEGLERLESVDWRSTGNVAPIQN